MMRLLFLHANLIVDEFRSFQDGAILINENRIEDIFPHSNKIKMDLSSITSIDIKGLTIIPDFYVNINNRYILDPLSDYSVSKAKKYADLGYRVMIGDTLAKKDDLIDIEYDGFYDLYENMTGFNRKGTGLVNVAFQNRDKYCEIDIDNIDEDVLKFTLDNLRKDRIILKGNLLKGLRVLKRINVNINDILQMTSLNAYRLYDTDKQKGSLIKGKSSDILCIDNDYNFKFKIKKGKLYV